MKSNLKQILEIVKMLDEDSYLYLKYMFESPDNITRYHKDAYDLDSLFTWAQQPQGNKHWEKLQHRFYEVKKGIW